VSKYREMSPLKWVEIRGFGTSKTCLGRQDARNWFEAGKAHGRFLRVDDACESAAPDVVGLFSTIVEIGTRVFGLNFGHSQP
jgi:hypothetical protein